VSDRRGEVGAATRLAGDLLDWVATTVEDVHTAVSDRTFRLVGPPAVPVRVVHDSLTTLVYGSVRGGLRGATRALGAIADRHPATADEPLITATPAADRTLAAITGIFGDTLAREHPVLDSGLGWRHAGAPLEPTREDLAEAHPDASGDLVVFAHGLCESEHSWWYRGRAHRATQKAEPATTTDRPRSIGEHLAEAHGSTPLYLRYNTGDHISVSGQRLADLLEATVAAWPVPVTSIALVGHSMGGLVFRSACHQAIEAGHTWPERVHHLVYLGTPHLGAPLEKGVNLAGWALGHATETRPFSRLLGRRSVGVKDLRFGYLLEEEWDGHDPHHLRSRHVEVPLLPGAQHHVVTATLTHRPEHPVGWALGDLLVRSASGAGRSRRRDLGFADEVVRLTGRDHFDLLTDPEIVELLLDRLDPAAPRVARVDDEVRGTATTVGTETSLPGS
jgi:hypothetical protein